MSDSPPAEGSPHRGGDEDKVLSQQSAIMSPEQLAESRRYARRELQCTLLDMALDVIFLAVMAFGLAVVLDRWLLEWPLLASRYLRLAALYAVTMVLHYAVSFPLSFYSGYILEHQFQLSRQSLGRWLWRDVVRNALVLLFGLVLVLGLYAIIWFAGPWWWIVAAAATFLVTVLLGQLVPVLILPLFYRVDRLDDPQLTQRLAQLTTGTSLNLKGVYRMKLSSETVKANAMLTGLGRTRRVILGDTLLDRFDLAEIEVVFAHEVGHHVFRHLPKMILLGMVTSAAGYAICDLVLRAWVPLHEGAALQYSQLPVYTLPLILLVVTLASLLLSPLQNAISRHFETQCDRYALQKTGNPAAFRSAFGKLAQLNKDDPEPHPWEVFWLHDHPPIAERIALADELAE